MLTNSIYSLMIANDIKNLYVIFYTDCVNFSKEELTELFNNNFGRNNVCFCVPKNVYYELSFMRKNSKISYFRNNAALILSHCKKLDWNLEDFYEKYSDQAPYVPFTCLFLFSDFTEEYDGYVEEYKSIKQKEFINNVYPGTPHYIWCGEYNTFPIDFVKDSRHAKIPTLTISFGPQNVGNYNSDVFEYIDKDGRLSYIKIDRVYVDEDNPINGGNEAKICKCKSNHFTNKYLKIYNEDTHIATDARLEKLKRLRNYGLYCSNMCVAFPEAIIYANGIEDKAIGFSMKKAVGESLDDATYNFHTFCLEQKNAYQLKRQKFDRYVKNIFAALLDLHCNQIYVCDLSCYNIMIDEKTGEICFVDCDSFQVKEIPGGGITPPFRHKDIKNEDLNEHLRYPLHEDFALAVLLYQMYAWREVFIANELDYDVCWETDEFQFDYPDNYTDPNCDELIKSSWNDLDEQLKTLFADELHFRKTIGIGSWIEALGFDK